MNFYTPVLNTNLNGFMQKGIAHLTYAAFDRIEVTITLDRTYGSDYSYSVAATILSAQVYYRNLSYQPIDGSKFKLYMTRDDGGSFDTDTDVPVSWISVGN